MKRIARLLVALAGIAVALSVRAGAVEVTVPATAGPWNWNANLNAAFVYGPDPQEFSPPISIDLASIGTGPGGDLFITYKSGLTSPSSMYRPPSIRQVTSARSSRTT